MTNGTGYTEAEKAKKISALLDLCISSDNVVTCTTPFRNLIQKYGNSRVLVVGNSQTLRLASGYGFTNCVDLQQYIAPRPQLMPDLPVQDVRGESDSGQKVRAILVFQEPDNWQAALQVMCDVLGSDGEPCEELGGHASSKQVVDLFFSNPDFSYATSHSGKYHQGRPLGVDGERSSFRS